MAEFNPKGFSDKAKDLANAAQDKVKDLAKDAQDRAKDLAREAQNKARDLGNKGGGQSEKFTGRTKNLEDQARRDIGDLKRDLDIDDS